MGQDHPCNRLGFSGTDSETEYSVPYIYQRVNTHGRKREEIGLGRGKLSCHAAGTAPGNSRGRCPITLCLGALYNQSLDVGCPGKVLVAKAIPEGGWQWRLEMPVLPAAGQHVPPGGGLHGASLCPSHALFLLSSAGPGQRQQNSHSGIQCNCDEKNEATEKYFMSSCIPWGDQLGAL